MSTYMQLIVEVTTGDDLVLDRLRRDDEFVISVGTDYVTATLHSIAYVPEEALE